MTDDAYEQLADALNALPNGFPRTPSRTEIRILKKIFSPEEAALAGQLGRQPEPPETVAARIGLSSEDVRSRLGEMARRGMVWPGRRDGRAGFRLAPFIVGVYEAHLAGMDHEFAHLIEDYLEEGGAEGIMRPQPALHRVVPAQSAVKTEWILPYDDVRSVLMNARSFRARDCICRAQQDQLGRRCDFPLRNCLNFSSAERPAGPNDISREEALAVLDETEEIGLVHTVSNVAKGLGYVCNCCGCCCGILRGITDWGIENSVARANYVAEIDADACSECGACEERCQVGAISRENDATAVDPVRCIGCGLCVTGCPSDAASLHRLPDAEMVHPPADMDAWERERLHNRDR